MYHNSLLRVLCFTYFFASNPRISGGLMINGESDEDNLPGQGGLGQNDIDRRDFNHGDIDKRDFDHEDTEEKRENLADGELSDKVFIQSTKTEDPTIWFDKEHPAFKYIHQMTFGGERFIIAKIRKSRTKRSISRTVEDNEVEQLRRHSHIISVEQSVAHIRKTRTLDPEWKNLWHLNGDVTPSMRIEDVWAEGYSGQGITIAIVDDGLEYTHPDLANNYDTANDKDVYGGDNDPYPPTGDRHGTQVAGLAVAVKDNNICTVGTAFKATLIGIRLIGIYAVDDDEEASALSHFSEGVDIYSNSWGPQDKTGFGKPGTITNMALKEGVTTGRNGKGAIYLFAAGNGETSYDNCNADGYVNSIYTIAVTSVGQGQNAWYAEVCAAALTAAYGGGDGLKLTTTTTSAGCTINNIQGTSYSTPLVSGIIALTLEANNDLTWRDIQHLIVMSSSWQGFKDTFGNWTMNGAGKNVSQVLGFGLIDAHAMVNSGKTWSTVPPQQMCEQTKPNIQENYSTLTIAAIGNCSSIGYLEHVTVDVTFYYSRFRGNTLIYLISPFGTRSNLLHYRYYDAADNISEGTHTWKFMSVHFWWEKPHGTWILEVTPDNPSFSNVHIKSWKITLYGTETDPRQGQVNDGSSPPSTSSDSPITVTYVSDTKTAETTKTTTDEHETTTDTPVTTTDSPTTTSDTIIQETTTDTLVLETTTDTLAQETTTDTLAQETTTDTLVPETTTGTLVLETTIVARATTNDIPTTSDVTRPAQSTAITGSASSTELNFDSGSIRTINYSIYIIMILLILSVLII